jgi:hypothetical protein
MLELGLIAALFFILLAVIASYLLKAELNKCGMTESNIEKTTIIAIGMPPATSLKAKYLLPGFGLPGAEKLSTAGKVYLLVVRGTFLLAVLSLVGGIIYEWVVHA